MKNYSYLIKTFFLSAFGISLVFCSEAQRGERHQQNANSERRSASFERPHYEMQSQRHDREITRAERQSPIRTSNIRHDNVRPVEPQISRSDNRVTVINRPAVVNVRVAPASRYAYYGNGYKYHSYYRPPVYNARNPGWRYAYLPPRRAIITSFPFAYQTINYGGFGYRYYDGTFYRPYRNSFMVVAPPIGLFINILPFGYRRIYVHDYPYYYYNGTYYDDYNDNYRVVAPPVGAVVESIPPGYEMIVIDGETYYKVDGVQYKPTVQDNGEIWYEVIKVD